LAAVDDSSARRRQRAAARANERRPAFDAVDCLHQLIGRLIDPATLVIVITVVLSQALSTERTQQQSQKQVQHLYITSISSQRQL